MQEHFFCCLCADPRSIEEIHYSYSDKPRKNWIVQETYLKMHGCHTIVWVSKHMKWLSWHRTGAIQFEKPAKFSSREDTWVGFLSVLRVVRISSTWKGGDRMMVSDGLGNSMWIENQVNFLLTYPSPSLDWSYHYVCTHPSQDWAFALYCCDECMNFTPRKVFENYICYNSNDSNTIFPFENNHLNKVMMRFPTPLPHSTLRHIMHYYEACDADWGAILKSWCLIFLWIHKQVLKA